MSGLPTRLIHWLHIDIGRDLNVQLNARSAAGTFSMVIKLIIELRLKRTQKMTHSENNLQASNTGHSEVLPFC